MNGSLEGPGGPWAKLPTVPVMHLEVTNDPAVARLHNCRRPQRRRRYPAAGQRSGFPGHTRAPISHTPSTTGSLFTPPGKLGRPPSSWHGPNHGHPTQLRHSQHQRDTGSTTSRPTPVPQHAAHRINSLRSRRRRPHPGADGHECDPGAPSLPSARLLDAAEVSLARGRSGNAEPSRGLYSEFRDSIDVPANYTLTFRVRLDDRPLVDGVTLGGWLGRWLFHCHVFFHHHRGMIGEFVVTDNNGKERPYVDVGGSWAYAPSGGTTTRHGTYSSLDGSTPISLAATYGPAGGPITGPLGSVVPASGPGGTWSWTNPVDSRRYLLRLHYGN